MDSSSTKTIPPHFCHPPPTTTLQAPEASSVATKLPPTYQLLTPDNSTPSTPMQTSTLISFPQITDFLPIPFLGNRFRSLNRPVYNQTLLTTWALPRSTNSLPTAMLASQLLLPVARKEAKTLPAKGQTPMATTSAISAAVPPVCDTSGSVQTMPQKSSTETLAKSPTRSHDIVINAVTALQQIRKLRRCLLSKQMHTMTKSEQLTSNESLQRPAQSLLAKLLSVLQKLRPRGSLIWLLGKLMQMPSRNKSESAVSESFNSAFKQQTWVKTTLLLLTTMLRMMSLLDGGFHLAVVISWPWSMFPWLAPLAKPYLVWFCISCNIADALLCALSPLSSASLEQSSSPFHPLHLLMEELINASYVLVTALFGWTFFDAVQFWVKLSLGGIWLLCLMATWFLFLVVDTHLLVIDDNSHKATALGKSITSDPTTIEPPQDREDFHAEVENVEYISSGGTHDVYLVHFLPDAMTADLMARHPEQIPNELILRIRRPDGDEVGAAAAIKSEIGIRKHVHSHLGDSVPTPRVYAWSDGICKDWQSMDNPPEDNSPDHPAWIAEEYVRGQQLCAVWAKLTPHQRGDALTQLAKILVSLAESRFTGIGSLHPDKTGLTPHLEPCMTTGVRWQFRGDDCYDIGPYRTTKKYVLAMFEKEIHVLSNTSADELEWDESVYGPVADFVDGYLVEKVQYFADSKQCHFWGSEPFTISHGDIAGRNILIDGTKITAILDWEWAAVLPLSENLNSGSSIRTPIQVQNIDYTNCDPADYAGHEDKIDRINATAHRALKKKMAMQAKKRGWDVQDIAYLTNDFSHSGVEFARQTMLPWIGRCTDYVPNLPELTSETDCMGSSDQDLRNDTRSSAASDDISELDLDEETPVDVPNDVEATEIDVEPIPVTNEFVDTQDDTEINDQATDDLAHGVEHNDTDKDSTTCTDATNANSRTVQEQDVSTIIDDDAPEPVAARLSVHPIEESSPISDTTTYDMVCKESGGDAVIVTERPVPQQLLDNDKILDACHHDIIDVNYMCSGSSHDAWVVTLRPDSNSSDKLCEIKPQIPNKLVFRQRRINDSVVDGNEIALVRNEVGVRTFLRQHFHDSVPTPCIHAWDDGSTGEQPFILEEYVAGRPLHDLWSSGYSSDTERTDVLLQLAKMLTALATARFSLIGGFDPEEHGPGPLSDVCMLHNGRGNIRHPSIYNIGPYHSTKEYVLSMFDKEISALDSFDKTELISVGWSDDYKKLWGTRKQFVSYLRNIREIINGKMVPNHDEAFAISHGDLAGRNIMVDDGKITAILDWEYAAILPLTEFLTSAASQARGIFDFCCSVNSKSSDSWTESPENLSAMAQLKSFMRSEASKLDFKPAEITAMIENPPDMTALVRRFMMPSCMPSYDAYLAELRDGSDSDSGDSEDGDSEHEDDDTAPELGDDSDVDKILVESVPAEEHAQDVLTIDTSDIPDTHTVSATPSRPSTLLAEEASPTSDTSSSDRTWSSPAAESSDSDIYEPVQADNTKTSPDTTEETAVEPVLETDESSQPSGSDEHDETKPTASPTPLFKFGKPETSTVPCFSFQTESAPQFRFGTSSQRTFDFCDPAEVWQGTGPSQDSPEDLERQSAKSAELYQELVNSKVFLDQASLDDDDSSSETTEIWVGSSPGHDSAEALERQSTKLAELHQELVNSEAVSEQVLSHDDSSKSKESDKPTSSVAAIKGGSEANTKYVGPCMQLPDGRIALPRSEKVKAPTKKPGSASSKSPVCEGEVEVEEVATPEAPVEGISAEQAQEKKRKANRRKREQKARALQRKKLAAASETNSEPAPSTSPTPSPTPTTADEENAEPTMSVWMAGILVDPMTGLCAEFTPELHARIAAATAENRAAEVAKEAAAEDAEWELRRQEALGVARGSTERSMLGDDSPSDPDSDEAGPRSPRSSLWPEPLVGGEWADMVEEEMGDELSCVVGLWSLPPKTLPSDWTLHSDWHHADGSRYRPLPMAILVEEDEE